MENLIPIIKDWTDNSRSVGEWIGGIWYFVNYYLKINLIYILNKLNIPTKYNLINILNTWCTY